MKRNNLMIAAVLLTVTVVLSMAFPLGPTQFIDAVRYAAGQNVKPRVSVSQTVVKPSLQAPLSFEGVKINNPWTAPGQTAIAYITVRNIGDQAGYPYNVIPLAPNQYTLGVGADVRQGDCAMQKALADKSDDEYVCYDELDWLSKIGIGFQIFSGKAYKSFAPKSCIWVPITVSKQKDGQTVTGTYYYFDCIKIIPYEGFEQFVKPACGDTIDEKCIANVNDQYVGAAPSMSYAELSSDVQVGTCKNTGSTNVLGVTLSKGRWECGVPNVGIMPGEEVEYKFAMLVPNNAPIAGEIPTSVYDKGFSQSLSCQYVGGGPNCHELYLAIYPSDYESLASAVGGFISNLGSSGTCAWKYVASLGNIDWNTCMAGQAAGTGILALTGGPLVEDQGIFFTVGPQIQFLVTIVLWLAIVGGAAAGYRGAGALIG